MVGIVVVSHSHALARAAVDIAREMLHGRDVSIAIAAGLDETTFGTDAVQVQAAIEQVDGPDGVLVLMDLGSAVLSAELALELIDASTASRVRLCAAPLVEGLVAAAVAAAGGASLTEVEAEAVAALAGKQSHLQPAGTGDGAAPEAHEPAVHASFVVANPHGLHARPAARLVGEVRTFDARVQLRNLTTGSPWVPGSSLSRVATLGALEGHEVEVGATGSQAREAVDHVLALASRHVDEGVADLAPPAPAPATGGPYPASPGIGIGPSWRPGAPSESLAAEAAAAPAAGDPTAEWRRVRSSIAAVRRATVQTRARTSREIGEAEAGIFDAHLMLLDDSELLDGVRGRVDDGAPAPVAWSEAMLALAADLEALPDEYQQARAADVRALHDQVLLAMLGRSPEFQPRPGVLMADDLTPAQASALDRNTVTGI
ncbi:MAG TPA: dihydroxyacetone kinase phosphoryl donor subunit DhaM, partial [Jiangellaceae bacterium]